MKARMLNCIDILDNYLYRLISPSQSPCDNYTYEIDWDACKASSGYTMHLGPPSVWVLKNLPLKFIHLFYMVHRVSIRSNEITNLSLIAFFWSFGAIKIQWRNYKISSVINFMNSTKSLNYSFFNAKIFIIWDNSN